MLQQHLEGAMTHLALYPIERPPLLQGQYSEAVPALPNWSMRHAGPIQNPAPDDVSRPTHVESVTVLVRKNIFAAELPHRGLRLRLISALSRSK
jgi:hypothetical protein